MKRFLAIVLSLSMLVGMAACSNEKESADETTDVQVEGADEDPLAGVDTSTVSGSIYASFVDEINKSDDIVAVAEILADESISGYSCVVTEMPEGYFAGFDEDIIGFNKAVGFAPMIGSIPFVCYIFDVDDAKSFASSLETHADPRWNICTEADETLVKVVDDYVFFIMCPAE